MKETSADETSVVQNAKGKVAHLRRHPFVIPVLVFLGLFFASLIGFVAFNGSTIGPADSRVVSVYVDEEQQTLPTRAKTVGELLERMNIDIKNGDVVEPAIDTPITQDGFNVNVYRAREVTIIDKNEKKTIRSADQSPRIVARKAGIIVYPEDEVLPEAPETAELLEEGITGDRYVVDRAKPITVILYGNVTPIRTQATTVGELFKERGIEVADEDEVSATPEQPIEDDQKIIISRPGQRIATKEAKIKFGTEYVDDASMLTGMTEVREKGRPGKKIVTYNLILENGKVVGRRKIKEIVVQKPIRQVVARGTKVIISNPSANVKLGQKMAAARGWTGQEWYCLYQLWQRESGWSATAGNASGAYGIPQALPGSKMASAGSDWQTNPATQISWGFGYIAGRYGKPCSAWATSESQGWY